MFKPQICDASLISKIITNLRKIHLKIESEKPIRFQSGISHLSIYELLKQFGAFLSSTNMEQAPSPMPMRKGQGLVAVGLL